MCTQVFLGHFDADLSSHKLSTKSLTHVAEQIASIFSVATLFNICNPDQIRSSKESHGSAYPCANWVLARAAGYGQPSPALRYLTRQRELSSSTERSRIFISSEVDHGPWALAAIDEAELTIGDDFAMCSACGSFGSHGLGTAGDVLALGTEEAATVHFTRTDSDQNNPNAAH